VERYLGWLLVAARLLVAIVFLLNGFGIIDQTIPAREMLERGVPSGCLPAGLSKSSRGLAWHSESFLGGALPPCLPFWFPRHSYRIHSG